MICRCCLAGHLSRILFGLAIWLEETVCVAIYTAAEAVGDWGSKGCK